MSYDLYFWREEQPFDGDLESLLDELAKERPVAGVASFSREKVIEAYEKEFPEIERDGTQLNWEREETGFLIDFSHSNETNVHMIIVNCGYSLLKRPDILNRIIDVAHKFGCGLYDPQVPQRYPEPDRLPPP